jgi:hypothetical protein
LWCCKLFVDHAEEKNRLFTNNKMCPFCLLHRVDLECWERKHSCKELEYNNKTQSVWLCKILAGNGTMVNMVECGEPDSKEDAVVRVATWVTGKL